MYGALDVSTSGMVAQRVRLEVISANLANKDALVDADGRYSPYLRRAALLAPGDPASTSPAGRSMGVHVAQIRIDPDALRRRYDPGHPFADEQGYLLVPDIDATIEQVNAMEALRAYEANVVAAEASKTIMAQALRLIA
jgi:flagellar basal-body rod protein FlgC